MKCKVCGCRKIDFDIVCPKTVRSHAIIEYDSDGTIMNQTLWGLHLCNPRCTECNGLEIEK